MKWREIQIEENSVRCLTMRALSSLLRLRQLNVGCGFEQKQCYKGIRYRSGGVYDSREVRVLESTKADLFVFPDSFF